MLRETINFVSWKSQCFPRQSRTVNCNPLNVVDFAMLPTQRYWQETVSLLNVMWPWSNQRECKLLGKNFQLYNHRPLLSSKNPHFKNEAKCTTFLVKMSFICLTMKNHFHIRGWALNLVLIERPGGTLKWSIILTSLTWLRIAEPWWHKVLKGP